MIDPNQPAFPELHVHHFKPIDGQEPVIVPRWMGGLSKREYFAAAILQGLAHDPRYQNWGDAVADAVDMADELIRRLGE